MHVADGQREGIGGIGRARWRGEAEHRGHHPLHLFFGRAPVADQGLLHLVGGVLHDLAASLGGRRQGEAARLTDRHRRLGVDLEEHPLDGDHARAHLGHQRPKLGLEREQSVRDRLVGVGLDHPGGDSRERSAPVARPPDQPIPAPGESGVDAEDEHAFDISATTTPKRGTPGAPSGVEAGQDLVCDVVVRMYRLDVVVVVDRF